MKKRVVSILLSTMVVAGLFAGCGTSGDDSSSASSSDTKTEAPAEDKADDAKEASDTATTGGNVVGVVMPTKDLQRWNQDGQNMEQQLKDAGYEVDIQYSNNDIATQVSQIETMISNGVNVLVIASIDGESLGTPLEKAKEAGIPVISYDRLIMNSDAISYYATFDNYMVGQKQGEYIKEALDLENAEGPFNLEIVTGDPGDNNAQFFYGGAMDVLQPYIDSGKLVVPSGQIEFAKVATADWSTEKAQNRMDTIISGNYSDGTNLDAVLCSNDSTSLGVQNALASSYTGEYPVITGQDCDVANVKNLIAGKQSMDIFKDTRDLANQTVKMVDAIMQGKEAEVNDTESYDNGTGVIPTYLCEPKVCTADNYKELLIDSGYYTEEDLK
ncbi:sugar ABC transporter substrate-binding protein [Lactonifactor longoviformis]|uniref:multiple monosaccharide ABC transporter substrate-binding protein n=1 Tax=Lactonifactor TaxID=420345 RepID=UPI0012AFA489|nr:MULTISPECIES: multiple monosaccharide ABC transporter substrate-binding protein [Lactonifactor]MCQ4670118.1 sugar ABC transporter substrate-binding protein [Lactonifactor longoviformis]MSA00703.1 substrate-binding domain-containing protein [Lactonifactor sp. BIOML-A5]MSA06901.1 substrate-binding domain-containing protein [Lactonifactor sp. BIOML-A4]MSA11540.1 substrate-binding domain-containing protein [Lactonifactor sp. BIOML-A3]MSA16133.1 substrate-binding domain-containing protein [Lacto